MAAWRRAFLVAALLAAAGVGAWAKNAPAASDTASAADDAKGALIGELVFHADLMSALDRLCPRERSTTATDWHAALAPQVRSAYPSELRELSRKLGTAAGLQVVRDHGGCATRGFAGAYAESQQEFRELLQRWRDGGQ
jgi:hypothetical protein